MVGLPRLPKQPRAGNQRGALYRLHAQLPGRRWHTHPAVRPRQSQYPPPLL